MEVIKRDGSSQEFDLSKITNAIINLFCGVGSLVDDFVENHMADLINTLQNTIARIGEIIRQFFSKDKKKKEEQDRCRMHALVMAALLLSYVNQVTVTFMGIAVILLAVYLRRGHDRESSDPLPIYAN